MSERNHSIDLIKTIAIFCVIVIHTCSPGYAEFASLNWNASLLWGVLARPAVPLFFMCSGALLLRPEKELGMKKLFFHSILRIVAALFFWAMFYQIYHLLKDDTLTAGALVQSIKEVILFRHEFHLYYLHIILLVYLFLPVTRILVQYANRGQLQYLLTIWLLLGIVYPTLRNFWPFQLLGGIPAQWAMNMTYAAVGYGILGYYLQQYPLSLKCGAGIWIAGFLLTLGGTWWLSMKQGQLYQQLLQGMSAGVLLMAVGIYTVCTRLTPQTDRSQALCRLISKGSFCVYLVHVVFYYTFVPYIPKFSCILSIPLFSLLTLVLSMVVYLLLSRVPVVRKWLI